METIALLMRKFFRIYVKISIKIRTSKEQGRIDKPEAPVTLGTGRRSKTNKTK